MKKDQFKNYVLNYVEYANSVNVHVAPTKGVSSGAHGRLFELLIKATLNNCRSNGISKAGRVDTVKKVNGEIFTFEIKTGAGELICLDGLGNIYSDIRKSDYVIYSPNYMPLNSDNLQDIIIDACLQAYIMPAKDFYELAVSKGMIRTKKSRAWYGDTNFSELEYDRITLQSVSGAKLESWVNALYENSQSLADWLVQNGMNYIGL